MKKVYIELIIRILVLIGLIAVLVFALKGMLGGFQMSENAQTEANKRWQEKNREKARYLRNRSASRNFVKKEATEEDLQELEELIKTRREELNKQSKGQQV